MIARASVSLTPRTELAPVVAPEPLPQAAIPRTDAEPATTATSGPLTPVNVGMATADRSLQRASLPNPRAHVAVVIRSCRCRRRSTCSVPGSRRSERARSRSGPPTVRAAVRSRLRAAHAARRRKSGPPRTRWPGGPDLPRIAMNIGTTARRTRRWTRFSSARWRGPGNRRPGGGGPGTPDLRRPDFRPPPASVGTAASTHPTARVRA